MFDRVLKVQGDERARIARDLHEGIGQDLTSMLLHLRGMDETRDVDVLHDHAELTRFALETGLLGEREPED